MLSQRNNFTNNQQSRKLGRARRVRGSRSARLSLRDSVGRTARLEPERDTIHGTNAAPGGPRHSVTALAGQWVTGHESSPTNAASRWPESDGAKKSTRVRGVPDPAAPTVAVQATRARGVPDSAAWTVAVQARLCSLCVWASWFHLRYDSHKKPARDQRIGRWGGVLRGVKGGGSLREVGMESEGGR
jgi:hypothetical protein